MIRVKIRDWVPVYGYEHTSTIWELSTDPNFVNIIYTKEDHVHLTYFEYDMDVPLDTNYFLRARKVLNNGKNEIASETIVLTADEQPRDNIILEKDLEVDEPSIYVTEEDVDTNDTIRVRTSSFRSNGDMHTYTHWILLDGDDKVLWKSMYDYDNLTSIEVPNVNQPYSSKTKITFKVIHGSNVGVESKVGNFSIYRTKVNFEIKTVLRAVEPLKNLEIKFDKIDPEYRLGIGGITVTNTSVSSITKNLYLDTVSNTITVPFWMLTYGANLLMEINAVTNDLKNVKMRYKITVAEYGYSFIKDKDYKYNKELGDWYRNLKGNTTKIYIPNNYIAEPLHNNLIPIPKRNTDILESYDLDTDGYLNKRGTYNGISIPNNNNHEGLFIKRFDTEFVLISRVDISNNRQQHVIDIYRHNTVLDNYTLLSTIEPENESYSLGYTTAFVQIDNLTLLYIPYKTKTIKKLNLETMTLETITTNIPYIELYDKEQINVHNKKIVSPIMMLLSDMRVLIIGGFHASGTVYDYTTDTFQESINWEDESFIGNELISVPLINGDNIIIKKEDDDRNIEERLRHLYTPDEFVFIKTLEEQYKEVNKRPNIVATEFSTRSDTYTAILGEDLTIDFNTNFTTNDTDQYYIVYDPKVFRLDNKNISDFTFRSLIHNKEGNYKIKIVASKDQIFDTNTKLNLHEFTHSIIVKELTIQVRSREETHVETIEIIDQSKIGYYNTETSNKEAELIYLYGEPVGYDHDVVIINCYKEDKIIFPIETVNVKVDDLQFDRNEQIGLIETNIIKRSDNLCFIEMLNPSLDDYEITINNDIRKNSFCILRFHFIDKPLTGLEAKPKLIRNGKTFENYSTLSFTDLIYYKLTIDGNISNTKNPFPNRDYTLSVTKGDTDVDFLFNIKKRGLSIVFTPNNQCATNNIYSNSFFVFNNCYLVPTLDIKKPSLQLLKNSVYNYKLLTDLTGFDNNSTLDNYRITINLNELSSRYLDIKYNDTDKSIDITTRDGYISNSFEIVITNIIDKMEKRTVFPFTIFKNELFPKDLKAEFSDSVDGGDLETIYILPNSKNTFNYTSVNGSSLVLNLNNDIINKTNTINSTNTDPAVYGIATKDVGKTNVEFLFKTLHNSLILKLNKIFFLVPAIWYTKDEFISKDTRSDLYPYQVANGDEGVWRIVPKVPDGYTVMTAELKPYDNYKNVKYWLEEETDEIGGYTIHIHPEESTEERIFKFRLYYTYVNNNNNDIILLEDDYLQTITVLATYYKSTAYIDFKYSSVTVQVGNDYIPDFKSTGRYNYLSSSNTGIADIEGNIIKTKNIGKSFITIRSGGPDYIPTQHTFTLEVIPKIIEPEKPNGFFKLYPNPVRLYTNTSMLVDWTTSADIVEISTTEPNIAEYDSLLKRVIGKETGVTRLKVIFKGKSIKGGTVYFDIKVLPKPEGLSSIKYYDSINSELSETDIFFKDIYPTSSIITRDGRVVLSRYIPDTDTTFYTNFN